MVNNRFCGKKNSKILFFLIFSIAFAFSSCDMNPESNFAKTPTSRSIINNDNSESLKILTHNVYMLPSLISDWAQSKRAPIIAEADYIKGHDIVMLQEAFDSNGRSILLNQLADEYPYQTPCIGVSYEGWDETQGNYRSTATTNGGVVILSKWPILEKIQYLFVNSGGGFDALSLKGFAYIKTEIRGQVYHIISTHVQAVDSMVSDKGVSARVDQFNEISRFISSKSIPDDEMVLIGGDFNVIKGTEEYSHMIDLLNVNEPVFLGQDATWDPRKNELAAYKYPYPENPSEYLDYIFVEENHRQPTHWQNLALDPICPVLWEENGFYSDEYSDHFPVSAFIYANTETPITSQRIRKYDKVAFKSHSNSKFISTDSSTANGWTRACQTEINRYSLFNLINIESNNSNCTTLSSGKVRVESEAYKNYYWNWYGAGSGKYGYYSKFNDASNELQIVLVNDNDGNGYISDQDHIAFKDWDTFGSYFYYLQIWPSGSWTDHLFLWSSSIGYKETFTIYWDASTSTNWSDQLIYQ